MESSVVNGKTVIRAQLYDLDSLLLRYTNTSVKSEKAEVKTGSCSKLPVGQFVSYTLDESNVYLMDKAEFALDEEPYRPAQELLRADNVLRQVLGWPNRQGAVAQPWVIHEPKPEHTVRLRFTVHCQTNIPDVMLALEDAELAEITCNGTAVTAKPEGWFTDKSIQTVSIGTLAQGENIIEIKLPFGRRTNVEWCYLLGHFGVQVYGEYRVLTELQSFIGFDDVTRQGLAHYGGNITYKLPVSTTGGALAVSIPHYAGAGIRVNVDGEEKGYIVYPPYRLEIADVAAGEHMLNLTLLGNRQNCFGPLHLADAMEEWIGPNAWRSLESKWTESYRLEKLGILSAPILEEIK